MLASSVEHYITQLQVDGIFCGGVMGEFWALTMDERKRVHATVATVAAGRVPVMAQVGHHAVEEAAELASHAQENGVAFGIAMNPYYPPDLPFPLVRAWYEAFAERTSLPLFLFNTPYSGASLTVDEIAELAPAPSRAPAGAAGAPRRSDRRRPRGRAPLAGPGHPPRMRSPRRPRTSQSSSTRGPLTARSATASRPPATRSRSECAARGSTAA